MSLVWLTQQLGAARALASLFVLSVDGCVKPAIMI